MTVSAIILAYNERLHIRRCVENVRRVAQEVFVVDCHFTDGTQEIRGHVGPRWWSMTGREIRPSS